MIENKVAILQSNYIPWKGVFDMINMVDTFVFFEDVDYTKRDWRSRNKIKTPNGAIWLSVPVAKSPRGTKISDIQISQSEDWQLKHYKSIELNYKKAPFYDKYKYIIEDFYLGNKWINLSEMNIYFTKTICEILNIQTKFINSKDISVSGAKDIRLIEICKELKATEYLSGPSAKDYIDPLNFENNNIQLSYIKYEYPEYIQMHGQFNHYISVLDVLFNCGDSSREYILMGGKESI
ncbi:WbqC family protein [Brumimicrobium aurantiacum]|uniref:WbqC family protein n=1 Tax=Brumimicrobium aurantiacum TaxID=1737063 RepID=A0A3E1F1X2_9FLAO|nr:WbqC family protein [Brumimicrobium aurantiacum]RFC55739.1 hypothetical protein DXU93_02035 [Brumimicrobium aurantiacum]